MSEPDRNRTLNAQAGGGARLPIPPSFIGSTATRARLVVGLGSRRGDGCGTSRKGEAKAKAASFSVGSSMQSRKQVPSGRAGFGVPPPGMKVAALSMAQIPSRSRASSMVRATFAGARTPSTLPTRATIASHAVAHLHRPSIATSLCRRDPPQGRQREPLAAHSPEKALPLHFTVNVIGETHTSPQFSTILWMPLLTRMICAQPAAHCIKRNQVPRRAQGHGLKGSTRAEAKQDWRGSRSLVLSNK